MSKRDYHTAYDLDKLLEQSAARIRDNAMRSHELKKAIVKLRKQRRQIGAVPDEVKQWFEDTEGLDEDEEM